MKYFSLLSLLAVFVCVMQSPVAAQSNNYNARSYTIVVYGDGFAAGHDLDKKDTYPMQLRTMLNEEMPRDRVEVINAGVDGDTAANGAARLPSILALKPDVVILNFGLADAYYGIEPELTRRAIEQMLHVLTYNNLYVVLLGTYAPDSMPTHKAAQFNLMYPELAKRYRVSYVHDFMDGVRDGDGTLQFDDVNPSEDGAKLIARNLTDSLLRIVRKLNSRIMP